MLSASTGPQGVVAVWACSVPPSEAFVTRGSLASQLSAFMGVPHGFRALGQALSFHMSGVRSGIAEHCDAVKSEAVMRLSWRQIE